MLTLYESQRLVCVEDTDPCQYWVEVDHEGPNPLKVWHKVRKKDALAAVGLFRDHPKGIEHIKLEDMRGKKGNAWDHELAIKNHIIN